MEDLNDKLLSRLVESVKEISGLPECKNVCKKLHGNLARRIKLLSPLFEELREGYEELSEEAIKGFELLTIALDSAVVLLKSTNEGSKLYQALQRDVIADQFHQMTEQVEAALSEIPYEKLDISEEVREQIELVHTQFKRAKGRPDSPDLQLDLDLTTAQREKDPDMAILKRLSEKLQLRTINDLKKESLAFHELVISSGSALGDFFEKMSLLLRKLKDCVLTENSEADTSEGEGLIRHRSPVIPDDFRCPISLELMRDPVIVSTGQTYERSCIQKWLDAGHRTCPKTQQTLLHTALTPNYVLKSLIALWCESNGVELPKVQGTCRSKKLGSGVSDCDRSSIIVLLERLANGNAEEQRAAAAELRLLAKRNADNRVCIAEAGAIPLLVELLSSPDTRTQEHAVTALLNLSINDSNKGTIVNAGAIPDIVDVLKHGSMEARENAAATLFSLSVVDENKVAIGAAGAIPALIKLLCEGTPRGKKDAATAIFNLSIYQGNKARAVRAGIVEPLMRLLKDTGGGMVDEALAILAILASHQEGKAAIGQSEPIPILMEVVRTGSPRNRENAAAVLWSLCTGDLQQLKTARDLGAEEALKELSENGTDRAKRKAGSMLELFQRIEVADTDESINFECHVSTSVSAAVRIKKE
ncbi:Arm domain-containing protein/U-box domain-containing protein/KAP domain-containing protein [Cephalotus follicularis]|uniref:RING-type E3 ubiquitin transferase n=1 Tax=Cephalotus follicularis TaxID=3775 RepID=A0A1Q3CCS6_CEPFO|nr:Arm domain-containing protein/U-box domain-containing protein/KAP domain-containing protein [Cephalotus follicularis]GAV77873.1 Arm domain-containing protein/U-box domain-containing protein/KAP domain-containing protein [Cephalotus follicularis]